MDRSEVLVEVQKLIADIVDLEPNEISEDSKLMEDIELASIEIMTMTADIEEMYSIKIEYEDMKQIVTVGDLVDTICKLKQ